MERQVQVEQSSLTGDAIPAVHREFLAQPAVAESLRALATFCLTKQVAINITNQVALNTQWFLRPGPRNTQLTQTGLREMSIEECVDGLQSAATQMPHLFPTLPNCFGLPTYILEIEIDAAGKCTLHFTNTMLEEPAAEGYDEPAVLREGDSANLDRLFQMLSQAGVTKVSVAATRSNDPSDGDVVQFHGGEREPEHIAADIPPDVRSELESQLWNTLSQVRAERLQFSRWYAGGRLTATVDVPGKSLVARAYSAEPITQSIDIELHPNIVRPSRSRRVMRP